MRLLPATGVVQQHGDEDQSQYRPVPPMRELSSSFSSSSSSLPKFSLLSILILTMAPLVTLLPSGTLAFTTKPITTARTFRNLPSSQSQWVSTTSPMIYSPLRRHMVSTSEVDSSPNSDGISEGEASAESAGDVPVGEVPAIGPDGVYHLETGEQHKALLEANPDKLIVLKIFAPWCRACKGLEPKFNAIVKDPKYANLPMVWASLTIQHNKAYVKSLGVLALPSIQFYSHGGITENFPCGPSKVPILKRKLIQFVNSNVDAKTLTVKPQPSESADWVLEPTRNETMADAAVAAASATETPPAQVVPAVPSATNDVAAPATDKKDTLITPELRSKLRAIPYLSSLSVAVFEEVMAKANVLTFEAGSIIMREGGLGRTFYFISQGEVEVCQRTNFEDPLTTPSTYMGTVINRLEKGDWFGERSLITGEPRAATIRASSDDAVLTLAWDKDDFPASCVLSGKADVLMAQRVDVDEKYGVSFSDTSSMMKKQLDDIFMANQVRGSVNSPEVIDGVDNDLEVSEEVVDGPAVPENVPVAGGAGWNLAADASTLVPLLVRFKLLRSVNRCFEYIMSNRPVFNEAGATRRRSMLVELLPPNQQLEFKDAFDLIDIDGDGEVTLMELRRSLESVGEQKTDEELLQLIQRSHQGDISAKSVISEQDFMGLMAETEFFNLFLDTFRALDTKDSGFVKARDLDRVLCGVRDLISDDRKSIIDVEDKDILIDYEQFSKMLLGRTLS